ncbi:hypothetical protein BFW01_g10381 [Lasiodiplodia theobromae]|uniref:Uncharacterized protein n=1 Tax=Lasiodiplodia theobromae TaxID=45133 RepID=A0A8H7IN88_9PEZI|nr:hypothetical protein BFW01_g10381 [Lasiodiplodia theobromae]
MSAPIPVILCGAMRPVAALVRSHMLLEYDVVYAGHDIAAATKEVPKIISGSSPPSTSLYTQIGSNDFTVLPRAVITGGGYNEEAFQTLFQACAEACGSEVALPVPFFRTDNALTDQLAAEGKGPAHSSPEYPKAMTNRLKARLREVGVGSGVLERPENRGKSFFF